MAGLDFWQRVAYNAHVYEEGAGGVDDDDDDGSDPEPQRVGACSNGIAGSARSVLTSYVVPPETWLLLTSRERRQNWVTPRIPPNVSLACWSQYEPPRLAYVREPNWEKYGARGLFSLTHFATANFGIDFAIGHPISPSLYAYVNESMGESGANFAILARNVFWVSAAIAGFEDAHGAGDDNIGGAFWVHYNDTGLTYSLVHLPYADFTNYMRTLVPDDVRAISWPAAAADDGTLPGVVSMVGTATPLTTASARSARGTTSSGAPPPLTGAAPAPGTTASAPLINETFYGVDMERFWAQFMVTLEIALFSPVASKNLLETLRQKKHWVAIEAYMNRHRGAYRWTPPLYARGATLGKAARPDYLSK